MFRLSRGFIDQLRIDRDVAYRQTVGDPRRILLVEDDPDISEILSLVLSRGGLEVESAASLRDARAALERNRLGFDAIVTDKNLPDGSGMSLLEEERAKRGDAEIVVITGFPSLDSAVQALRLGAYDYLEKPFRNLEDVVATVRRACEHRRVRRERDEARTRAVLAERRATLVQVAAGLAHEVKNPLHGIGFACSNVRLALAEAKLRKDILEDVFEQVGLIEAESKRLRDLVEGVMDLARPAPRPRMRMRAQQLLRDVAVLHTTRARDAGVTLSVVAPDALELQGDEADLSRALDNLVRNALDVAPRGSTVSVTARPLDARSVTIEVADQGPGFPPESRSQVFTPFFTTKARGFGLGLCTVAAAADRAGGTVEILDNIPSGARVILRLPALTEGT
jgi:signal transduction histidine kinase